ncbi:hypothetical protein FRC02_010986 [Tulasnella sp. 418]|nr:hypothetical protein FRC02_010986 [Tulasnella sp. 418]
MPRDVRSIDLGISTRLSMSSRPNGVTKEMTSTTSGIAPSMSSTLSSPNSQLAISPAKGGISAGNSLQSTGTIGEKHTGSIQPNAPGRRPRETSAETLDAFNLMLEVEEQRELFVDEIDV